MMEPWDPVVVYCGGRTELRRRLLGMVAYRQVEMSL